MRIKKIERLIVKYHEQIVGTLSLTPDNKQCAFEYDKAWLSNGFSISPLELPLKPGLFIAKPSPFYGNFGVFEDSLPDGYGRYLLHKALLKEGINDTQLSALDRLSLVGNGGMGALTYEPETSIGTSHEPLDFDLLQEKGRIVRPLRPPSRGRAPLTSPCHARALRNKFYLLRHRA